MEPEMTLQGVEKLVREEKLLEAEISPAAYPVPFLFRFSATGVECH